MLWKYDYLLMAVEHHRALIAEAAELRLLARLRREERSGTRWLGRLRRRRAEDSRIDVRMADPGDALL